MDPIIESDLSLSDSRISSKFFSKWYQTFWWYDFFEISKMFLGNHSPINETMQRVPSPFEKLSETNLYIRGLSADVSIDSYTPPTGSGNSLAPS